jgi:hypothetical protein
MLTDPQKKNRSIPNPKPTNISYYDNYHKTDSRFTERLLAGRLTGHTGRAKAAGY